QQAGHDRGHGDHRAAPDPDDPRPALGPGRGLAAAEARAPAGAIRRAGIVPPSLVRPGVRPGRRVAAPDVLVPGPGVLVPGPGVLVPGPGVLALAPGVLVPAVRAALAFLMVGPARAYRGPRPRRVFLVIVQVVPGIPAGGTGIATPAGGGQPAMAVRRGSLLGHGASGMKSNRTRRCTSPQTRANTTTVRQGRGGRTISLQRCRAGQETLNRRPRSPVRRVRRCTRPWVPHLGWPWPPAR